ncbi:alcohol acyltransferase 9-like [Vicia villosa]|uniref:alcohol acyltransferase 9-like n=1 Tax=Vicia villosa TaxID=3911 RepID=UPI00273CC1EF|nr:alcohol acyltransferase 9-like [Vicia villosa]
MTITPRTSTPNHSLSLTNLDDAMYMRISPYYLCFFKKSLEMDSLKSSLSRVLVDYYPLAGRLRKSTEDENKLVIDCNGEGVLFVEASMDITIEELLTSSMIPNSSWNKLHNVKVQNLIDIPPLIIQVTNLRCGGMILCASISHSLCDGIGASQFLNAWSELTRKPFSKIPASKIPSPNIHKNLTHFNLESSVTMLFNFGENEILCLKKQCITIPFKHITSFEAIAAHIWRSRVKACKLPSSCIVKLIFPIDFRKKMKIPKGYYGNGIVLACAKSTVKDLVVANNLDHCVELVQQAKANVNEEYVKSVIAIHKDKTIKLDSSIILRITQWSKLGLIYIDFGEGKPLYVGSLNMKYWCMFLPVIGDSNAVRVILSVPENIMEMFHHYVTDIKSWREEA